MRHALCGLLLILLAWQAGGISAPAQPGSTLSNQLRWVEFEIAGGRVSAASPHFGRSMNTNTRRGDRQESLSIQVGDGAPQLQYELRTPESRIGLQITDGINLHVTRQPADDSVSDAVEFTQTAGEDVVFAITGPNDTDSVAAPSLWHILLARPAAARQHLIPLLEILQPDWELAAAADQLEVALLEAGAARRGIHRALWTEWVAELANPSFAVRQAADRKLRGAGPAVLPFLQGLDRTRLDAEQQLRVQRLVSALAHSPQGADVPERVAAALVWDPLVWFYLLSRDELSTRRLAKDQLQRLLEQEIAFDPAADPAVRAAQIAELAGSLGQRTP